MIDNGEMMRLLMEIHAQNAQMLVRIDELEQTATKRGAIAGAVAAPL